MSVQFGRWNFDGKPVGRDYLEKARASIAPYGPDDAGSYSKSNISILYYAFHTTKESRRETQPHVTASGAILTWDGRLDNRAELIRQFRATLTSDSTDIAIVAAAYGRWGADCLGKLVGDWAVSIWDPQEAALLLARDFLGARPLYYLLESGSATWCTILDPLLLFSEYSFELDERYIAGWLSVSPATELSPYVRIAAVPPSHSVLVRNGRAIIHEHWCFDSRKVVRCASDSEYEEAFRSIFTESVRRRLRSDSPVLAELSGGMDSSSIVCVADRIIAAGSAETPRLDTISYYNPSEPNWNEWPYFTKVEEQRGREGCHIDARGQQSFSFGAYENRFAASPACVGTPDAIANQFIGCLRSRGNRAVLSGIGGDEVLGGVPTPVPELANLLVEHKFKIFARQVIAWALAKRKPVAHLFLDAIKPFFPPSASAATRAPCAWLDSNFLKRNRAVLRNGEPRIRFFGPPPSFQLNLSNLNLLRRQLALNSPSPEMLCDWRYPCLDRDLLEFLFALPPEQLVRPGYRRSLMRRSFATIVPKAILERKRKAYVEREPVVNAVSELPRLLAETDRMSLARLGIVIPSEVRAAFHKLQCGGDVPLLPLIRLFALEDWIRSLDGWNVASNPSTKGHQMRKPVPRAKKVRVPCPEGFLS